MTPGPLYSAIREIVREADLPVVAPSPAAYLRVVENDRSRLAPVPDVQNAAAILVKTIDGVRTEGELKMLAAVQRIEMQSAAVLAGLGLLEPIAYAAGLTVSSPRFTVRHNGVIYYPKVDIPFITGAIFEEGQWQVAQGIVAADLAAASGAYMMGFSPGGTGSITRPVAEKLRDVVNVRDYGGSPENEDNLYNFYLAFAHAHEVEYGDGEWLISEDLIVPSGRTLRGRKNASILKLREDAGNEHTRVVRLENDAKAITCVFDGNLDAREANGFAGYVFGFEVRDASRCVVDECHSKGVGASDAFFAAYGGNGGGYLIVSTETATQDTERNIVRGCTADSKRSGFIGRIATPFHGYAEGELPYAAKNNTIENISGEGCNKNAVELVGPNTWGNTVKDSHVYDITGQGGFEADFGAHHNRFERCTVEFRPGFVFERTFDAFSQRSFDEGDGKIKISHDNSFIDCSLVGGETAGNHYLRGFCEIGASRGARWVRPKMRGFTRGAGVGNDRIIGHYQEATMVAFTGGVVEDPEFVGVDEAFRYAGAMGYTNFRIYRGYTQSRQNTWRTSNTSALNGSLKFRGGVHDCYGQHFSFAGELLVDADDVEFRGGVGSLAVVSGPTRPMSTIKFSDCDFTRVVAGSVPILSAQNQPCYIRTRDNTYGARAPGGLTDGTQGRAYNGGGDHVTEPVLTAGRRITAQARVYGAIAPTTGTWYRDDQVLRRDASTGASLGWRCTASGTFGSLTSIVGTASAASDQLLLNSIGSIVPGQYIAVTGSGVARHLVTDVLGNVATISPASINAVSGATISYASPIFEEIGL